MLRWTTLLDEGRRFGPDGRGNAAIAFAVALIPLAAVGGAAVDYARAAETRAKLQAIVDAAVLNGLKAPSSQRTVQAEAQARAAVAAAGLELDQIAFTPTPNQGLRGRVRVRLAASFAGLLGAEHIDIAAGSEGFLKAGTAPGANVCLMLADPSAAETLRVEGAAAVRAPNCEVHLHTTANVGAVFGGGTAFDVRRICLKGAGYIANGNPRLGPIETGCRTAADPFGGQIPVPRSLACGFTDKTFEAPRTRQATVLEPGVYCGDTRFEGRHDIVLKPGLYVIRDGAMTAGGGSSITGAGVTFFLADARSSLRLDGRAEVRLSAPAHPSDPHRGVLMFEPAGLGRSAIGFTGGSDLQLKGLIHLPSRNVTFGGSSKVEGEELTMVLNALVVNGGATAAWKSGNGARTIAAPASGAASAEIILRY